MQLFDALQLSTTDIVALVGGGGKTSVMFALGKDATSKNLKTVLTTTTRIFYPADSQLPIVVTRDSQELFSMVGNKLSSFPIMVAGAELSSENKLTGLAPDLIQGIMDAGADLVIVEADGAARKPFKAPAGHEPVIPNASTIVIPVVGIDCLDQPLQPEYIHRPEIVAELAEISLGERVTPEVVARVLTHPLGFRKNLPVNCRWTPIINKVETAQDIAQARKIAMLVGELLPCRVILGAAMRTNPVVEILDFN